MVPFDVIRAVRIANRNCPRQRDTVAVGGRATPGSTCHSQRRCGRPSEGQIRRTVRSLTIIVGVFALALLSSCSKYGDRTLRWEEQIQLSSGDSAVVGREQRIEFHLTSDGASGDRAKMSVVRSASNPPSFPEWKAPLVPFLLDVDPSTGRWTLVATMATCDVWRRNQEPQPPYWAFQVDGQRWQRTSIPESFWNRRGNLFANFTYEDTSQSITSTYKSRLPSQARGSNAVAAVSRTSDVTCGAGSSKTQSSRELDLAQFGVAAQ